MHHFELKVGCMPVTMSFDHLIATLKPQSNGPLYSNTVIGIHLPLMGGL